MNIYRVNCIADLSNRLGQRGYVLKNYFANFFMRSSDIAVDIAVGNIEVRRTGSGPWRVWLAVTGPERMIVGRPGRVLSELKDDEACCMTNGDGAGGVSIGDTVAFHKIHGKLATIAAVTPPRRYGRPKFEGRKVEDCSEKPEAGGGPNSAANRFGRTKVQ